MTTNTGFRQRLDAVLRTLDVAQVRNFLIAEEQWSTDAPADPELAMWIMVAGSAALRDLHGRARTWLLTHGHEAEAEALLMREKKPASRPGQGQNTGKRAQQQRQKPPQRPRS
jgi:hypothetical protein